MKFQSQWLIRFWKKRSKKYELEIKLCEWIKSKNESGMVLSGDDIRSKAKAMSQNLRVLQKTNPK